jgi:hypothetical protein
MGDIEWRKRAGYDNWISPGEWKAAFTLTNFDTKNAPNIAAKTTA